MPINIEYNRRTHERRRKLRKKKHQRTKAQRRELALTIVFTVFSNQPPEPEAAEQGIRHKEKPKKKTGGGKKKDDGNWIKIIRKPETEPREGSGRSRGGKNETGGQKQSKKKQIYREEKERKVEEQHRDELALPLPSSLQTKKDPESVKTNSQKAGGLTARERPKTERIRGGGGKGNRGRNSDRQGKQKEKRRDQHQHHCRLHHLQQIR